MTALLEIKQRMKEFYAKYDIYIIPAVKFILAMAAFFTINSQIGFMEKITSPVFPYCWHSYVPSFQST